MKALVVGQGGREHAIIKALALSKSISEIHALPGNPGIAKEAMCHKLSWRNHKEVIDLCRRLDIDFVVIGPEDPLVDGLCDSLRENGILCFGPNKEAAQLEASKIFAKEFMAASGVPTAKYKVVTSVSETLTAAQDFKPPFVLKADGLAAGKGVFICQNLNELKASAQKLFEENILGDSGSRALLEENLAGWELSYLVLTNGDTHQTLPLAQDHKRLKDHDLGPNTGGMGTIAPLNLDSDLQNRIENEIVIPSIAEIKKRFYVYRGVLFIGVMVTANGPKVLEYNVRFGDPETQVILPLLDMDFAQCIRGLCEGKIEKLKFKTLNSACVIIAAEGYPDAPIKGTLIQGDCFESSSSGYFVHAGTSLNSESQLTVGGGRVLGAVGIGSSKAEAIENAYTQAKKIKFSGMQMRSDIGAIKS